MVWVVGRETQGRDYGTIHVSFAAEVIEHSHNFTEGSNARLIGYGHSSRSEQRRRET